MAADASLPPANQSLSARIAGLLDQATAWASIRKDGLRKYGLAAALLIFVVGLVWAFRETPELRPTLRVGPLLLLLILSAPTGTVLNTIELHILSRMAGGPMSWRTSAELTVYTSAANMLPLPGGAITKLAGMKAHGVSYSKASMMVLLSFLAWAGFTFLFSAIAIASLNQPVIAGTFALLGTALLGVCALGFARFRNWRLVAKIAGLRVLYFAVEVLRYWSAFAAIGTQVSLLQCSTFVVASVVGAAVVIAPQGLGVVEATAALMATLVGIGAGLAFIAAALQRVVRLVGMALIAALFMAIDRKRPDEQS